MTQIHILVIALKVAAIFLFISVVQDTPEAILNAQVLDSGIDSSKVTSIIAVPAAIKLIVSLVLWFFPKLLITATMPDVENSGENSAKLPPLYKALIPAIGIYLVAIALSDLAYYLSLQYEMQRQFASELQPSDKAGYIATVVQIILGILLIVGSKFANKVLARVRA